MAASGFELGFNIEVLVVPSLPTDDVAPVNQQSMSGLTSWLDLATSHPDSSLAEKAVIPSDPEVVSRPFCHCREVKESCEVKHFSSM